eukprot:PhF_6_TR25449/c0_g1_i5/m.35191
MPEMDYELVALERDYRSLPLVYALHLDALRDPISLKTLMTHMLRQVDNSTNVEEILNWHQYHSHAASGHSETMSSQSHHQQQSSRRLTVKRPRDSTTTLSPMTTTVTTTALKGCGVKWDPNEYTEEEWNN